MRNIFFAILLMVCGVAYGQKEPVYTAKELQQKLENQRIDLKQQTLEDKVAAQDKSIDEKIVAQDKRIEDASNHFDNSLSWLSIVATLITVGLGFGGFFIISGNREARVKLEQEMEDLKAKIAEDIKNVRKDAKTSVEQALAEIDIKKREIESLLEKAKGDVDYISNAKNIVEKIQRNNESTDNKEVKEETRRTVKEIDEKLPVIKYTYYDWFAKGYDANEKQKYQDAIFYYRKATESKEFDTKSDKSKAAAYNNWGNTLTYLAELKNSKELFEESFEKYEKAIHIKSDYAFAHNNWGSALSDLAKLKSDEKLFEAAFEKYDMAIQIDENYAEAYNNWGATLIEYATLKGGVKEIQGEIKEKLLKAYDLGNTISTYNLTCLYSLLDKKDEVIEWFEKALKESEFTRGDFETEPELKNLRQDPRFEALLNKYRPLKEEE